MFIVLDWLVRDINIDVKDGMYGHKFIMFSRGKAKISLSPNVWRKFRQAIPELRTEGKVLQLSDRKKVSVTRFGGSLFTTLTAQGMFSPYHINLGEGHWKALLEVLPQLDKIFAPGPTIDCPKCKNELRVVPLFSGRLQKTLLSDESLALTVKNNQEIGNQMGYMCEYCGDYTQFDCHCHKVNCMTCSPDCFCNVCGRATYYYYD